MRHVFRSEGSDERHEGNEQHIWRRWVNTLRKLGIEHWVAAVIENGGPITFCLAQAIYLAQPLLNGMIPDENLQSLIQIFEDPKQAKAFSELLREQSA